MKIVFGTIFLWTFSFICANAQSSSFIAPSSICLNQTVALKNTSTGAVGYLWDFCNDGLTHATGVQLAFTADASGTPEGIEIANDNGQWFGFYFERDNNNLYRLDFGADLENTSPTLTNLGNLGNQFNLPTHIRIVKENSTWFGIVVNFNSSSVTRLDFGTQLSTPAASIAAADLGSLGLSFPRGLDLVNSPNGYIVFASSWTDNSNLSLAQFSNGLGNSPTSVRTIATTISKSPGLSLISDNGNWYGLVAGYQDGSITHINFGTDPFDNSSTPIFTVVTTLAQPRDLKVVKDGLNYYSIVETITGLTRIEFGNSMSIANPPLVTALGNFSNAITDPFGISLTRFGPSWRAFTIGQTSGQIYRVDFQDICSQDGLAFNTLTTANPVSIFYENTGTYQIDLIAYNAQGGESISAMQVKVDNLTVPTFSFSNDNNCIGQINHFNGLAADGSLLTNGLWDFGNGNTATGNAATFQFPSLGNFPVMYSAAATNGCSNVAVDTISIFNPPQANFDLPAVNPICSNQNYLFSNNSISDNGSNPAWLWTVNGNDVSTAQDLNYVIPAAVTQNVTLTASIPGCSSQSSQSIVTVLEGPLTNFSSPNIGCVGTSIPFTNTTTGTVTNFGWSFGDGNTSSQTDTTYTYSSTGTFDVTLTASNAVGCQNFVTKSIPIYSNPQPDFAIEAPPYSCANYPAQFDNNTPPLSDSNVTTWAWTFGDPSNGTSDQKNPSYTFSAANNYNVTLQAISNFGCTGTKQHNVTIYPSPQSAFSNSPACVNQNTQFTNASSGGIASYQWVIQSTIFNVANPPPYVFKTSGTFPVSLSTTSGNGCKNQAVKNVDVPVLPLMDFIFQSPCAGAPTIFQELNPGGPDPSVAWNWNFGPDSGTGSPVSYSYGAAGVYSVTLSATRNSGCVYSTSRNVAIYDRPVAAFTPSPQGGAPPLTVTFNNQSTADSYFWQLGSGNSSSSEVSPTFTYTDLGEYTVLLTASNIHGCMDSVSTKIYVVVPKVDLAMQRFSLREDPGTNSSKPVVTMLNLGNIPITNPEVKIDLGGNVVLKETVNSTVLPGKSIQQTLNLEIVPQTLGYICAAVALTDDVNISNDRQCLSLSDNDILFYPYPNPAGGQINFDWISAENENVEVAIYKSTGQLAFKQSFQMVQPGINQLAVDISSLSSGLYLIQFAGANAKKTFNVMVIN